MDIRDQQLNDPSIVPVLQSKEVGVVPHHYELNTWSRESRQLIQMWSSLNIENALLWRWCIDVHAQHLQLVLPSLLIECVLKDLYSGSMGDT